MNDSVLALGLAALLGLMIGSFLNVVIHRLPLMLQAQWDALPVDDEKRLRHNAITQPLIWTGLLATSLGLTGIDLNKALWGVTAIQMVLWMLFLIFTALYGKKIVDDAPPDAPPFNLAVPRSHCPHCQHTLAWYENIPLLSFIRLHGRCAHCQAPIGWRYPTIELITAGLFMWAAAEHGLGWQALLWAGFAAALVALAAIDADTRLLPDAITQPLVWAGLLAASLGMTGMGLNEALWGAAAGYLFLWTVYWLFKAVTGKEGMGQGDFKLLAALGAWLGWPALLSLILIASFSGVIGGLWLKFRGQLDDNGQLAFGPFLVLAGLWVMAFGPLPWFLI